MLDRHRSPGPGEKLDRYLAAGTVELAAVTKSQVRIARSAYRNFGRDSGHPAALNFGDCFAYALAIERDEPLLHKGDDFSHTELRSALSS